MMGIGRLTLAFGAALAIGLAGCAETQLVASTTKIATNDQPTGPTQYKVGKPYEIEGTWYYPKIDYSYDETGIASWYGDKFHGKPTASGEAYDMNALTAAHRTLPMPTIIQVTNLDNGRSLRLRVNDRGPFAHGRIIDVSRRAAQLLGFIEAGTARVRVQVIADESQALASALTNGQALPDGQAPPPAPAAAPAGTVTAEALPPPPGATGTSGAATPSTTPTQPGSTLGQSSVAALEPDGTVTQQPVRPTDLWIQAGAFTKLGNAERLKVELSRFGPTTLTPIQVGAQKFYRVRVGPMFSVEEADRILAQIVQAGHTEARIVVE